MRFGYSAVMSIDLRPARPHDIPTIHGHLHGLAVAEGRPNAVTVTPERLTQMLFASAAHARCLLIELDAAVVGHIWFYERNPTFTGGRVLYLEDLFITPEARNRGIGREVMARLAALALSEGFDSLDWTAMAGNEPAVRFYAHVGASQSTDTIAYRLAGEAFRKLASQAFTLESC